MRVRPHAEIPDTTEDTNRDSDAPTQLWSGRLSLSSLTPRLRAARHRQRLEALLNTQTGITFEAHVDAPEAQPRSSRSEEKAATQRQSTNPPVVTAAAPSSTLSGPQLALFVAVGVAVGGIAALHMDHLLHPFAKQARDMSTERQSTEQRPSLAAKAEDRQLTVDGTKHDQAAAIHVAVAPVQTPRSLAPKLRSATAETPVPAQANAPAAAPASHLDPQLGNAGADLRIPTQLHPRINPLMTSNQVFKDE